MARQVLRRIVIFAVTTAIASVLVFAFMAVLPGDPAKIALGVNATPEAVDEMQAEFGTDRPLTVQYVDWVSGLPFGDFGDSYVTRNAIGPRIVDRLLVTLWLVSASMLLAVVVAVPLGTLAAVRHRETSGAVIAGLSQLGVAVPGFLVGILLVTVFAVKLGWLPSGGWTAPVDGFGDFLRSLALPAVSLAVVQGAILTRYVRSAVLGVLRQDYLRTARAKGLRPGQALVRHGLRNAAVPVLTVAGLQLATLLIGAVVIERVFVIPGLGSLLLDGVANRDLLLVQGVVMVLVVGVLAINLVVDLLYTVVDPRLRRPS